MRRPLVPTLLCLLALAACGGGQAPSPSPSAAARSSQAPVASGGATSTAVASPATSNGAPSLTMSSPADSATVAGPDLTVTLDVRDFNVVSDIGGKPQDGEGHIHFYLDVDKIPTTPGEEAVVTGEGRYVAAPTTTYTWKDVGSGRHKIGAQLVQNDHTPLEPPVTAEVTITVRG